MGQDALFADKYHLSDDSGDRFSLVFLILHFSFPCLARF